MTSASTPIKTPILLGRWLRKRFACSMDPASGGSSTASLQPLLLFRMREGLATCSCQRARPSSRHQAVDQPRKPRTTHLLWLTVKTRSIVSPQDRSAATQPTLTYPSVPPPPTVVLLNTPDTRRTEARAVQLKGDAEGSEKAASRQATPTVDFVGLPARAPGAGVDLPTVLEALFEVGLTRLFWQGSMGLFIAPPRLAALFRSDV